MILSDNHKIFQVCAHWIDFILAGIKVMVQLELAERDCSYPMELVPASARGMVTG